MLWASLILAIAKSRNLKPESGTWKQGLSIRFFSNVKMCFYIYYLNVNPEFLVPPRETTYFPPEHCIFLQGLKKKKRFWPQASASRKLQNLCFFVLPQEMATCSTKTLHLPGMVQKNTSPGLCFPKTPKPSLFLFFWYLLRKWQHFPPKPCIFLEGLKTNQKNKDFGLGPLLPENSKIFVFLIFLVNPEAMAISSTKALHFPGQVAKKTQKIYFGLRPVLPQDSKIFVVFGFLVPPQEMATFSTKALHFPGGVPSNGARYMERLERGAVRVAFGKYAEMITSCIPSKKVFTSTSSGKITQPRYELVKTQNGKNKCGYFDFQLVRPVGRERERERYTYTYIYASPPKIHLESSIWPGLCPHRSMGHLIQTTPTVGVVISLDIREFQSTDKQTIITKYQS